ncbi:MAG: ribokinase [Rhodobacteraceae bacterium CG17_big_fil_post_rev_8_21_14_2_50_65_11]|nr:MAG: ribokinase [Rhodobacteraceae bacterium CG17_big_fil_post_rev_8_21_14_2_50_65_11]
MTVYNLGSINIDHSYRMAHLPAPGETIAARELVTGLGGKGANQSIAIARAGGDVRHIGRIGPEGGWTVDRLAAEGVDVSHVATGQTPTGHAIIAVDDAAENAIILFPGANRRIGPDQVAAALAGAQDGDWLLLQNETSAGLAAARMAREKGLKVCYCAAPFDSGAVREILPHTDLLSVNEGEEAQLRADLSDDVVGAVARLVTYGARGAAWIAGKQVVEVPAVAVTPVDTTGAGDCFLGTALAGVDAGDGIEAALARAAAAAALQVTRQGAADAIPTAGEVAAFLAERR